MSQLQSGMKLGGLQLMYNLAGDEHRQVFTAMDAASDRAVVVKIARFDSPHDMNRLEREFEVLQQAAGPGVAPALSYGVSLAQKLAWLTFEPQGLSLANLLAASPQQALPMDLALAAAHGAAEALAQLHERGWRHGDVKPGNLLCDAEGRIHLADLELAAPLASVPRRIDAPRDEKPQTSGTAPFLAPELWRDGPRALSAATDVWALGVTFYLCAFGDYPFGREGEIAAAIERGLPPASLVSPPVAELLSVLLSRDPARRAVNGAGAAQVIAHAAARLGVDLERARVALGERMAIAPLGVETTDPGTIIGPPLSAKPPSVEPPSLITPEPPTFAGPPPATPTPAPEPPPPAPQRRRERPSIPRTEGVGSGWTDSPRVPKVGAAERPRVEGVGASDGPLTPAARALMRDYFDVKSNVVRFDRPRATTATAAAPAAAPAKPELKRRAAARWYTRMNPHSNYPLSVVISGKRIRIVGGAGLGITLSEQEFAIDPNDPTLIVEPSFPGCLISPPQAVVQAFEDNVVCRFWVTPLVCGDLKEACVTIRHQGKLVETLATPAQVVTRTLAKVLTGIGLVSPVVSKVLSVVGWSVDGFLQRWAPLVAAGVRSMDPMRLGVTVAAILLVGALFHVYVTRPLLSEEPEPGLMPTPA